MNRASSVDVVQSIEYFAEKKPGSTIVFVVINEYRKCTFIFSEYLIAIFELLFHRNCLFCKS